MFDAAHTVEATTRAIRVRATPVFLDGQSIPQENRYLWAYDIHLENLGLKPFSSSIENGPSPTPQARRNR